MIDPMKNLKEKILNGCVSDIPEKLSVRELNSWLNGYVRCQLDILEMIDNEESSEEDAWTLKVDDEKWTFSPTVSD